MVNRLRFVKTCIYKLFPNRQRLTGCKTDTKIIKTVFVTSFSFQLEMSVYYRLLTNLLAVLSILQKPVKIVTG